MGVLISKLLFQPPETPTPMDQRKYFWLKTKNGSKIPVFHIKQPNARFTVLYSHGNAEDLGMIYTYAMDLSRMLYINVIAYDYSGYGLGTQLKENIQKNIKPTEDNCYKDIEAVYEYLTQVEMVSPGNIVLYGRSVGSGPSCYLAERICTSKEADIAGMILHSPFLSVIRVVLDMGIENTYDVFPNISRIPNITCPTFILHGTRDCIVPFYHGKGLYEALSANNRYLPFWAENMGHNNIEYDMGNLYIKKLQNFLLFLLKYPSKRKISPVSLVMGSEAGKRLSTTKNFERRLQRKPSPKSFDDFGEEEKDERTKTGPWCRVVALDYGEIECSYVSASVSL